MFPSNIVAFIFSYKVKNIKDNECENVKVNFDNPVFNIKKPVYYNC